MQAGASGTLTLSAQRDRVRTLLISTIAVGWVRTPDDSVVLEVDSPQDRFLPACRFSRKTPAENLCVNELAGVEVCLASPGVDPPSESIHFLSSRRKNEERRRLAVTGNYQWSVFRNQIASYLPTAYFPGIFNADDRFRKALGNLPNSVCPLALAVRLASLGRSKGGRPLT